MSPLQKRLNATACSSHMLARTTGKEKLECKPIEAKYPQEKMQSTKWLRADNGDSGMSDAEELQLINVTDQSEARTRWTSSLK